MNESSKILKELIEFIEENDVKDEICDDGDGHTDEWRSDEFNSLINRAKETINATELISSIVFKVGE